LCACWGKLALQAMKLNIGCGSHYAEGFTNIDTYSGGEVKPDVVMSALELDFNDDLFDLVYMGHVLEHIPEEDVVTAVNEAWRVLKPGHKLYVVGPDYRAAVAAQDEENIEGILHGGREWPGDEHHWVSDAETLRAFLDASKFEAVAPISLKQAKQEGAPVTSLAYWQTGFVCTK